jgi:hypothetical protein
MRKLARGLVLGATIALASVPAAAGAATGANTSYSVAAESTAQQAADVAAAHQAPDRIVVQVGHLQFLSTGCLAAVNMWGTSPIKVRPCDPNAANQKWAMRFNGGKVQLQVRGTPNCIQDVNGRALLVGYSCYTGASWLNYERYPGSTYPNYQVNIRGQILTSEGFWNQVQFVPWHTADYRRQRLALR